MEKLRVWWIPQVPMKPFYIPVQSPVEGKKVLDILAAYDCFQYNNNIKPDYANTGGLQMYNEDEGEWEDWYIDDGKDYYDSDTLFEYCKNSEQAEEIDALQMALFEQVEFD